jgi:hypothetical protein
MSHAFVGALILPSPPSAPVPPRKMRSLQLLSELQFRKNICCIHKEKICVRPASYVRRKTLADVNFTIVSNKVAGTSHAHHGVFTPRHFCLSCLPGVFIGEFLSDRLFG